MYFFLAAAPKLIVFRYLCTKRSLLSHKALPSPPPAHSRSPCALCHGSFCTASPHEGLCVNRQQQPGQERVELPPPSSYFSDIISHFSMGNSLIPAIINTGTAANEPRAAPALAVTPWAGSFPGPSPHQRGQRCRGAHGGAERGRAVPPPGLWQAPGHSTAPLVLLPNPPSGRAAPHSLWSTGLSKLQGTGTAELNYPRCSPVCPTTL